MSPRQPWDYFARRYRPARIARLKASLPGLTGTARVPDVGGRAGWWQPMQPATPNVTGVNVETEDLPALRAAGYGFVQVSGCASPFADGAFDIVMSNSVIEHLGSCENQQRCAQGLLRCGRAVSVLTPNRWFPIEPHLLMPMAHWLRRYWQRRLIPFLSIWALTSRLRAAVIDGFLDSTRLLTRCELMLLFPGCDIAEERVPGLVKSYTLTRGGPP